MSPNPADLVTFTVEMPNGKLPFFCNDCQKRAALKVCRV